MADLFREVDEMMKQERLEKFWKENGLWIIAFIVLTIAGTAGVSIYKSWNNGVKEEQTTTLLKATEAPNFPEGLEEIASDFRPALRGIAYLGAAQSEMDKENRDSALSFYKLAAEDNAIPLEYRDMGILMQAQLDTMISTDDKLSMLSSISNNTQSPWRYHAALEAAVVLAHEKQDFANARLELEKITKTNPALPASFFAKAKNLEQLYTMKQKTATPTTPATDTAQKDDKES
jgi:hypothetical protein